MEWGHLQCGDPSENPFLASEEGFCGYCFCQYLVRGLQESGPSTGGDEVLPPSREPFKQSQEDRKGVGGSGAGGGQDGADSGEGADGQRLTNPRKQKSPILMLMSSNLTHLPAQTSSQEALRLLKEYGIASLSWSSTTWDFILISPHLFRRKLK